MKCPKCHAFNLASATECDSCGVTFSDLKRGRGDAPSSTPITGRCEYPGCHLPGAVSDSTRGGGPWFCRWHFKDRTGAVAAEIVDLGKGFVPETPHDLLLDVQKAADRFCVDHGLNTVEERRAYIREAVSKMVKKWKRAA